MSWETVINTAKFAWDVIKDGKPSAQIDNSTANAVPDVEDWQSLTNTRGPMWWSKYESVDYLWPLDDYVHVQFQLKLNWDYGARYKGGGAYIPNIWVEVPYCYVGWGWDANISLTVRNPTNHNGSGEPPLARVPVTLSGTIESGAESYTIQHGLVLFGNGNWEKS